MIRKTPSVKFTVSPDEYVVPFTVNSVTDNKLFSTSVSLFNKPFAASTFNDVSSLVTPVSAAAIGASFTGVTVIVNVLVAVSVPSLNVYVTTGTAPLKLAAGVNT